MKCLICQAEMPPATEDSPRVIVSGRFFGACAEHFPSKRQFPDAWEAKYVGFVQLAKAEAEKQPASAGQIAMMQAVLERQGASVQPEAQSVQPEAQSVQPEAQSVEVEEALL